MNRHILSPILTILVAGVVAFAVTRWQGGRAPAAAPNQLRDTSWLAAKLDLTPDQQATIDKLQAAYASDLESCCEMQCSARFKLGEAFFSADLTEERKADLFREMSEAQAKSDAKTLEHIRAIHGLLNADQKKVYEKLVEQCLCSACPTCGHH